MGSAANLGQLWPRGNGDMAFITFEGVDGSGKSTHLELLVPKLTEAGYSIVKTREPGGTALGENLRDLVLGKKMPNISPMAEMLLMAAARAQHVAEVIRPALERREVVLCDRYIDSSLVYQGLALGLGIEPVLAVNDCITEGLWPDLTVLLTVSPGAALERSARVQGAGDRIESRGLSYFERVCEGYLLLARRWPERIVAVSAEDSIEKVQDAILSVVSSVL